MGFSGCFVVLRTEIAPTDLVSTRFDFVHDASDWEREDTTEWLSGWRVWRYYGELPSGYPQALVEAASAPIVTAQVVHSDAARVEGFGLRTGRWAAWLMVGGAAPYFETAMDEDFDEGDLTEEEAREAYEQAERAVIERLLADAPGGAATAQQAVAWAEEGGFTASADAVLAALDGYRVFAEEAFFDLLTVLGVRSPDQPHP
jgi:hypothetical protein